MTEENKISPTVSKGGMVSPEMFNIKEVVNKARNEMAKPEWMPTPEVLELFKVEKLHDIVVVLTELVDIFKVTSKAVTVTQTSQVQKPTVTPDGIPTPIVQSVPVPQAQQVTPSSPRMAEVLTALKEFMGDTPLLNIDENTSAQYIIVKAKGFLGGGNFGKVMAIIRQTLGGEYVSQGKESHFRVPKLKA